MCIRILTCIVASFVLPMIWHSVIHFAVICPNYKLHVQCCSFRKYGVWFGTLRVVSCNSMQHVKTQPGYGRLGSLWYALWNNELYVVM